MPPLSFSKLRRAFRPGVLVPACSRTWLGNRVWPLVLLLVVALGGSGALVVAQAQAQGVPRNNPDDPRLVIHPGGHTAPVRSLIFTEARGGGRLLLSAGFDKVIHVWSLDDGPPRLVRTLRPPIYRGHAGSIYAMALSPKADAHGNRLLAVAGIGVRKSRGTITLFHFPGTKNLETGDVAGVLPEGYVGNPDPAEPRGHTRDVTCLAFDPTGEYLASAGTDGTVRLWKLEDDLEQSQTVAVLEGNAVLRLPQDLHKLDTHTPAAPSISPQGIAFSPDGRRLLVGDRQARLRLWDVGNRSQPRFLGETVAPTRAERTPSWINALAISPDGRWALVGQENGLLSRHELTAQGPANPVLLPTKQEQGPVEALALSQGPDGSTRMVTSILRGQGKPADRPIVDCDIELWDLWADPAQTQKRLIARTDNLALSCRISPDGGLIVYSGGNAQGLYLHNGEGRRLAALEGRGRGIWDLGFTQDSRGLGFSTKRPDQPGGQEPYRGLNLADQEPSTFALEELHRARHSMQSDGWTWWIEPFDFLNLQIKAKDGQGKTLVLGTIPLDAEDDRRWWDYTFLPNGRGGHRPVVAVATDWSGVLLFKLRNDGQPCERLRQFSGHNGAVYCLAPSPDGRWLASGSSDQTLSLWRLEGCETPARFGARFEVRQTAKGPDLLVKEIDPLSFAAQMGLKVGDIVNEASITDPRYEERASRIADLPALLDEIPPNVSIALRAWRLENGAKVPVGPIQEGEYRGFIGTTKRDNPALSLFADNSGDWVAWMPQGYYETSAKGDQEYLGWHRNRIALAGASEYFPAVSYEATFRRQDVLDSLFRTANPISALQVASQPPRVREEEPEREDPRDPDPDPVAAPPRIAEVPKPPPLPLLEIVRPAGISPDAPLVALNGVLPLTIQAQAGTAEAFGLAGRPIESLIVKLDNWTLQKITPPRPLNTLRHQLNVPLRVGRQFLSISAIDDQGRGAERGIGFEVEYYPEVPDSKAQGPRLWVLSFGAERFADPGLEIAFAGNDARAVADFLVQPGGKQRFSQRDQVVLDGSAAPATSTTLQAQLEQLRAFGPPEEAVEGLGQDDTLFVFLESHLLDLKDSGLTLLGAAGRPENEAALLPADQITQTLGQLADYGCQVVLLLDLVHETSPETRARSSSLQRWIRQLCYERGIIVVTASSAGPSQRAGQAGRHGAFALGLIELFQQSPTRLRDDPDAPWTLDDFQDALATNVARYTQDRAQRIGYYKPWTFKGTTLFFDPPDSPASDRLAKARAGE